METIIAYAWGGYNRLINRLSKPAQRAVQSLANERAMLLAQVEEIGEALRELARTYGERFRDDAGKCRWDFADDEGQVVLMCVEREERGANDMDTPSCTESLSATPGRPA